MLLQIVFQEESKEASIGSERVSIRIIRPLYQLLAARFRRDYGLQLPVLYTLHPA